MIGAFRNGEGAQVERFGFGGAATLVEVISRIIQQPPPFREGEIPARNPFCCDPRLWQPPLALRPVGEFHRGKTTIDRPHGALGPTALVVRVQLILENGLHHPV